MSLKVVKYVAVPATALLGFASFRVHSVGAANVEGLLIPQQLSIYTPLPQKFHYVEEQPGSLQSGLATVRGQLQSYLKAVKSSLLSAKVGAVNLYYAGEDMYHYLKDPPPGFVPRVGVITGAGLAGVILARKGSRLRRLLLPLGLASLGAGICYPAQTLMLLKVSGRQAWAASQWCAAAVSSLWRAEPTAPPPPLSPPPPPPSAADPTTDTTRSQSSGPEPSTHAEPSASDPPKEEPAPPQPPAASQAPGSAGAGPTSTAEEEEEELLPLPLPPATPGESSGAGDAAQAHPPADMRGFATDPQLMDFGQSNPEDADLYSTRG